MSYDDEESNGVNTSFRMVAAHFQSFKLHSGLGDYFHGMGMDTIQKQCWNSNAPAWRQATQGLNLEGKLPPRKLKAAPLI